MCNLRAESRAFIQGKSEEAAEARQRAALLLLAGFDLDKTRKLDGAEREVALRKLARLIERERLKGARRHWSYDLNRHIALKQAFEALGGTRPAASVPRDDKRPHPCRLARRRRKAFPTAPAASA